WMIGQAIATEEEINNIEKQDLQLVREAQRRAWDAYRAPIDAEVKTALGFLETLGANELRTELQRNQTPYRRDAMRALTAAIIASGNDVPQETIDWRREQDRINNERYDEELYSASDQSALKVEEV